MLSDTFSPLAFPDGRVIYNFTLSDSPASSLKCFPFELNREAQVVLYLADGSDLVHSDFQPQLKQESGRDGSSTETHERSKNARTLHSLGDEVLASRSRYQRAILHQLLVFDFSVALGSTRIPTDALLVPAPERSRSTTIKTVMCDITARMLRSMDDLAREMQNLSIIESPSSGFSPMCPADDIAARVHARMSMPGKPAQGQFQPTEPRNPAAAGSPNRSITPVGIRSASRHSVASHSRTDHFPEVSSAHASRDASQDRSSVVSLTATTPTERKKTRSIARSRIVVGAIFLQAGLWPDALKDLSEGTAAARSNNDYIWHAKGLEYIIACLLMLGWVKAYFQVRTGDQTAWN